MDSRAAYPDSDNEVQDTDCRLERFQEAVLVKEHAVLTCLDTKADTRVNELDLSLTYLSEDMVKQSIICVVIHGWLGGPRRAIGQSAMRKARRKRHWYELEPGGRGVWSTARLSS